MKKFVMILALLTLFLAAGCGGGSETTADEAAKAADAAASTAETQVAVHDCDGGCGMTKVPVDQLTQVDDKFYCTGCAKHAQEEDHSGHNH